MVTPSAPNAVFDGLGDFLRDLGDMREVVRVDVEEVARGAFRHHQRVAGRARHDVEKRERAIVLVDLVARQFAAQDLSRRYCSDRRPPSSSLPNRILIFAERRVGGKLFAGGRDIHALALEIIGDRAAQPGIGDVMGRIGRDRHIAARELVLALRAGLDALEAVRDRIVDGLVIANLEMQERMMLDRAPMAAIERIARR